MITSHSLAFAPTSNVSFAATTPMKIAAEYQAATSYKIAPMVKSFEGGLHDGPLLSPPGADIDAPKSYLYEGTLVTLSDSANVVDTLGAGNDAVYGAGGADRIWGGGGHDYLFGGAGDDELYGGSRMDVGNDSVGDSLFGGAGNDRIICGDGDDFVYAGSNTGNFDGTNLMTATYDEVQGNGGNDMIYLDGFNGGQVPGGHGGAYYVDGGTGNDTFIVGDIEYAQITPGLYNDAYSAPDTDKIIFTQAFHGHADIQGFQDHEKITIDGAESYRADTDNGATIYLEGGGSITVEGYSLASIADNLIWL